MTDRPIKKPKRTRAQQKNPGGRPTSMTTAVVTKLEYAYSLGCSDAEACFYAGISKHALYDYCKKEPAFSDRKELLKKQPIYLARKVQVDALLDGDKTVAVKLLERHDGTKSVLAGDPDNPLQVSVVERRIVRTSPRD